jgi:hypothetical protein
MISANVAMLASGSVSINSSEHLAKNQRKLVEHQEA